MTNREAKKLQRKADRIYKWTVVPACHRYWEAIYSALWRNALKYVLDDLKMRDKLAAAARQEDA